MLVNIVDHVLASAKFWTWIWANLNCYEIVMTMFGHNVYSVLHLVCLHYFLILDLDIDEDSFQLFT